MHTSQSSDQRSEIAPQAMTSTPSMPLLIAADLQDNLMTASNDLERLQTLLAHACEDLLLGFHGAVETMRRHLSESEQAGPDTRDPRERPASEACESVMNQLSGAITALQFQDMASQLIEHTNKRLRNCADRLARETMMDDEDGVAIVEEAPLRPNPVTQDEMDAGSVELF